MKDTKIDKTGTEQERQTKNKTDKERNKTKRTLSQKDITDNEQERGKTLNDKEMKTTKKYIIKRKRWLFVKVSSVWSI